MTDEEYRADLAKITPPKGESELAETAAKRSLMQSVLESNDAASIMVGQIEPQAVPSYAFHYFTFRGYYDYARMVQYMDPYAGFGGNSIPQYSTIDAVTVVNVMGGRGYAY